ncbi:hypothetical protein GCM10011521_04490 [Arenimonas soli]|uniref:Uncharacterized protein n=1 Tax=Arenimonas soli TaxID=2269504 RepID=A0ABQ1HCE0_9GAMM|nr:hypothetical protein GCM10011521_04490 [Arenimonas soli]
MAAVHLQVAAVVGFKVGVQAAHAVLAAGGGTGILARPHRGTQRTNGSAWTAVLELQHEGRMLKP